MKSFMFPYHHGRNLFNQMKANTIAIWRGEELPEQNEKERLYGHCIIFFETMTESLMQLCLNTLVLREFGLSPNRFEASNQLSGLFSSLLSIILLFAKVRTKHKECSEKKLTIFNPMFYIIKSLIFNQSFSGVLLIHIFVENHQ